MHKDDVIRLRHMLDSAREALSFVAGKPRAELEVNRMLALSLVKSVEIKGEAASRVSPDGRAQCNEIPWQDIIAMRNRLIHAYFDINLAVVWHTVTKELPPLVAELEKALASGDIE